MSRLLKWLDECEARTKLPNVCTAMHVAGRQCGDCISYATAVMASAITAPRDLARATRLLRMVAEAPCECPELFVSVELDGEPLYRRACQTEFVDKMSLPCRIRRAGEELP